jgi:5-methylcytosine-specific restriction protein B
MATTDDLDNARPHWLVGAAYGGTDDQTDRFLSEGIWDSGTQNKYLDLVRSMRTGERIAIKASYTRKHGLPFDNRGEFVSVLGIKAVGRIVANLGDGHVVRVDWAPRQSIREWYFFTDRATVWRVVPGNWKTDALIAFVFEETPQDVDRFAREQLRGVLPT